MTKVGLVLGAGGVVGQAYHAGVLAALEHDLGWDPRTAEVIVGSSAGSVTGTLLRLGVPAGDLASWLVSSPLSVEGMPIMEAFGNRDEDLPGPDLRDVVRPWRAPTGRLLARVARRPLAFRPGVAALTLLPRGRYDLRERTAGLDEMAATWPEGLWLCVARRDDGARVVLGRPGAPPASLSDAVAASCAIPGTFAPVEIGGVSYFDGGVHSPTSADVLRGEGLDVVVVVSPMSSSRRLPTLDGPLRWRAHQRLLREVARLEDAGTTVVRYEPGLRCARVMGVNAMASDRSERVVRAAFLAAGALRTRPGIRERLAPLDARAGQRPA